MKRSQWPWWWRIHVRNWDVRHIYSCCAYWFRHCFSKLKEKFFSNLNIDIIVLGWRERMIDGFSGIPEKKTIIDLRHTCQTLHFILDQFLFIRAVAGYLVMLLHLSCFFASQVTHSFELHVHCTQNLHLFFLYLCFFDWQIRVLDYTRVGLFASFNFVFQMYTRFIYHICCCFVLFFFMMNWMCGGFVCLNGHTGRCLEVNDKNYWANAFLNNKCRLCWMRVLYDFEIF